MDVITSINDMREFSENARAKGKTIGFVPTMGFLHEGHLSLVRTAVKENDITVASIFINPVQFGPCEDLSTYPRDFASDRYLLEKEKTDVLFYPSVQEMYPEPSLTHLFINRLTDGLCGAQRKGHFEGVALVVAKLFNITKPNRAYFGAKDWQQQAVIRRMVKDLNFDIHIEVCPIVREEDGLAMSSRNIYLSQDERTRALVLNRSLDEAERMVKQGQRDCEVILKKISELIASSKPDRIDYVSAVDPESLQNVKKIDGPVLFALAVKFGKARLIDNRLCSIA
ncbi:pantoate--beta-alanine ligase [bacterium]|nr:pantoate--beta-alanine ligase [bacterium]